MRREALHAVTCRSNISRVELDAVLKWECAQILPEILPKPSLVGQSWFKVRVFDLS